MPPRLEIRLLGAFELRVGGGEPATLPSARAQSLLGYLLLHRTTAVARERVAAQLWPESTEAQARTNLRHVLHLLRHGPVDLNPYLDVTPATLRWRAEAPYWLDVAAFDELLAAPTTDRRDALRAAVALWRGALLEGCDDGWLAPERDAQRRRLAEALRELAELCGSAGGEAEAIVHAERLLRLDPLTESTYRLLMRLHDARGDRPRALRTFHLCSTTLERELGVRPSAATQAAYQALLPRTSVVSASPQVNSPFVGRDPERARLATAWRDACAGRGRLCLVSGEAGVGKTRLTEEFRAWCARRGVAAAEARCYAAEGPLPYAAVTAWLRADAVRPRLVGLDQVRRVDLARLLPDLLLELGGPEPPPPLPEDEQRARIFAATAAALDLVGERLVLLVDDLQYADRETCRLIHYLLRAERPARLLVLATVRTGQPASPALAELLAALGEADQLVRVELSPFGVSETAALAERLTGARPTTEDAHRLHQQTGGNPFFLVESVRAGWRPGSDRVPLSPRVQAVLETRLAGLAAPTRELAEAAALLGRAFDVDLLAAVLARTPPGSGPRPPPRAAADEDALVAGLDELWRAGVIRERGSSAFGDTYDFTHEALREVASSTVSPVRRPLLHRRIADALEHRAGAGREELSAEVAFHLAGAGKLDQAARRYHRAAEAAQLLHAHAEAIRLLEQALTLVVRLPTGQDRDALELTLRTALLSPLVSEQGYASAAVAEDQQRAVHLTRVLGAEASPPLLRSLAMTALTEDRFGAASDYGRRLRAAAGSDQSGVLAVEADVLMGFAAFWRADFAAAREHLEAAVAGYRPERSRAHLIGYGQDPKVVALARLGNTRWFLGDPTGAREARAEALAWAEVVGHPYSRAAALLFAALLALDSDEETELRRAAAALQQTGVEALPVRLIERALHGHLRVLDADPAAGLALIKESIERARAGAAAPGLAAILARIRLAACAAAGDPGAVAAAADDLLTTGTAAAVWAPEAERMRAAGLARTR